MTTPKRQGFPRAIFRPPHSHGFTLLELMVVLGLIGLMLLFTIPRFGVVLTMDPALRDSRWILVTIDKLKRAAVVEQQMYTLQIDVPANRLWVTRGMAAADGSPPAVESGIDLNRRARLIGVEYPGPDRLVEETARIRFFPQGYSDRAIIHLALDERRQFSFWVEPFLARTRLFETYTGFAQ